MNSELIQNKLQQCNKILYDSLQHDNPLLNQALTSIKARSGKMMRPVLVLLSAELFGGTGDNPIYVAAGYEAFHTASLIHDDVVDESEKRRGQDSLNCSQGNKVAILVGDYILAIALKCLAATGNTRLIGILSDAAQGLSNGELLQLSNIDNNILSEKTYFDIIRNKTATLFAACAQSGTMIAGAGEKDIENMRMFGELVGMCFQIKDDIFDIQNDDIGKPTNNDMREGKLTLPTIYALQHTANSFDEIVQKIKLQTVSDDEIRQLVKFTKEHGGIEYAISVMEDYAQKAKILLKKYPESKTKTTLIEFVDYAIGRNY